MCRAASSISSATRPRPRGFPVNTAPLSDSMLAGSPCWLAACRKTVTTSAALKVSRAAEAVSSREWSSMMLRISAPLPSANCQWVMSSCQRALGWSASNLV